MKSRERMEGNSCHEFFKVYLSQLSSKKLGLPPAFVSRLGGKNKIPNKCTIKDPNGKIWQVKLEVAKEGLVVVANGWQEFASHHSLDDGDFLVFDYDGNSRFGVKMYGINGLQKRKALDDACASGSRLKKKRRRGAEARSSSLPMSPRPQELRLNRVHQKRNSEMPLKKTSASLGCHEHFSVKLNQSRSHAICCKAEEAASNNFTSAYPYFKAVLHCGSPSVPGKFVIDHIKPRMEHTEQMVKKLSETKLVFANGKWSVTLNIYFKYGSQGKLSAGWPRFVRDNCLEAGDECFFELINNNPVTMKVSIFKHNGHEHASRKLNPSRVDAAPSKSEEATSNNNITSGYPYFKAVMRPCHFVANMSVPRKFVMDHIKPKMELHARRRFNKTAIETKLLAVHGRWIVGLNVYFNDGGRGKLSAGWLEFVRDNRLEVGDECVFELIKNDPVIMKVSIFKHNSLS